MQTCISRRAGSGTASCLYQTDDKCHSNTPQTSLRILYMSVEPGKCIMHKSLKSMEKYLLHKKKGLFLRPVIFLAFKHF